MSTDVPTPSDPSPTQGSSIVTQPRAIAGALMALLLLVVSGIVGYRLLSSSSDDDASDSQAANASAGASADRADGATGRTDDVDDGAGGGDGASDDDGSGGDRPADEADPLDDEWRLPAWSLIASLTDDIPSYPTPNAEPDGTVAATWHGRQSALAVVRERGEWLQVRLQDRPNGSTTWVLRRDVEVTTTPYFLRIDRGTMRLQLWEQADLVMAVHVGVGTDDAPTPTGSFFVTFLQEPPDDGGNWGPFIMVTSGHSETISDFQLSGDAITGIHGPLGTADRINAGGAQVSKGCVRLQLDDLMMLRDVPAGSPIEIIDTSTGTGATA